MIQDSNDLDTIRIVVVGDTNVGKTTAINKFIHNTAMVTVSSTVGAECHTTTAIVNGEKVNFQIWDTAGQERFRAYSNLYIRQGQGIALFFDVTCRKSFLNLDTLLQEIDKSVEIAKTPIVLFGNKVDIFDCRAVSQDEAISYAQSHNLIYYDTSAVTGEGLSDAFSKIAQQVMYNKRHKPIVQPTPKTVNPEDQNTGNPEDPEAKSLCC